jgi:hypothetical protein
MNAAIRQFSIDNLCHRESSKTKAANVHCEASKHTKAFVSMRRNQFKDSPLDDQRNESSTELTMWLPNNPSRAPAAPNFRLTFLGTSWPLST